MLDSKIDRAHHVHEASCSIVTVHGSLCTHAIVSSYGVITLGPACLAALCAVIVFAKSKGLQAGQ